MSDLVGNQNVGFLTTRLICQIQDFKDSSRPQVKSVLNLSQSQTLRTGFLLKRPSSCCILYSSVSYLYVSGSGSITSVVEERVNLSAIVYI